MSCNHSIGIEDNKLVYEDNIIYVIKERVREMNEHMDICAQIYKSRRKYKNIEHKDILDARRGHFHMFYYCPVCGEKIDWKTIKGNVKKL